MTTRLIIDTGFILALMDASDRHHDAAVEAAKRYVSRVRVTTWPVLTELSHFLIKRAPAKLPLVLALVAHGELEVFDCGKQHAARIAELMETYSDLPMDLADASLVILAESMEQGDILSTDRRDFQCYRWKNRKPFRNLLLDT